MSSVVLLIRWPQDCKIIINELIEAPAYTYSGNVWLVVHKQKESFLERIRNLCDCSNSRHW